MQQVTVNFTKEKKMKDTQTPMHNCRLISNFREHEDRLTVTKHQHVLSYNQQNQIYGT